MKLRCQILNKFSWVFNINADNGSNNIIRLIVNSQCQRVSMSNVTIPNLTLSVSPVLLTHCRANKWI